MKLRIFYPLLIIIPLLFTHIFAYYLEDFECDDLNLVLKNGQTHEEWLKNASLSAATGKRGVRLPHTQNNTVSRNIMQPINSDFYVKGFYFQFSFKLNPVDPAYSIKGNNFFSLARFHLHVANELYSNPTLQIQGTEAGRLFLQLHMREDKEQHIVYLPKDPEKSLLEFDTWYTVSIFIQIDKHILRDSLFLNQALIGQDTVILKRLPDYLSEWSIGTIERHGLPLSSIDIDDIIISKNRASVQLQEPELRTPLPYQYLSNEKPVFQLKENASKDIIQSVHLQIISKGKTKADSLFAAHTPLQFKDLFQPGAQYACRVLFIDEFGRKSSWCTGAPFYISADSTLTTGQSDPNGQISLSQQNRFTHGDTMRFNIRFSPQKKSFFIDFNICAAAFDKSRQERYGAFDSSANMTFSIFQDKDIYYKYGPGSNQWYRAQRGRATNSYPYNFFIFDEYAIDTISGRATLAVKLHNQMRTGMWTINAYIVDENLGTRTLIPSIFFYINKKQAAPIKSVLMALILALLTGTIVFIIILRRKKGHEEASVVWLKIAQEIEQYLNNNYKESELNNNTIAEYIKLSVSRMIEIYQAVNNKSPLQHLREIRIEKASLLLKDFKKSIAEVGYEVGFKDPIVFQRNFQKIKGKNPTDYRNS